MNQLTKKVLITIFIFVIYRLGFFLDPTLMTKKTGLLDLMDQMFQFNYSLMSLSLSSAMSGFLIVEIIFIIIPPLRKIRNMGFDGRKLITKCSIVASFVIAGLQSFNLVKILMSSNLSFSFPLVADYPFGANLFYSSFYIVGFALVLFLGLLISRYGIGNGFCIIIAGDAIIETVGMIKSNFNYMKDNYLDPNYIGYICLIAISCLIFHLLYKKDVNINIKSETIKNLRLPFFLQGIALLSLGTAFITVPLKQLGINLVHAATKGSWSFAFIMFIVTIIISLLGHWIFSSKARISSHLSIPKDSIEDNYLPHLFRSTLVLGCIFFLFSIPFPMWNQKFIPTIMSLSVLILFIAILIDTLEEAKFINNNNDYLPLCSLDNVHFASLLKDKLNEQGVSHHIQGYQYRRLLFFLQPFIKMKILVAASEQNKAKEIFEAHKVDLI